MQVPVLLTLPYYITCGTSCWYRLLLASGMLFVHYHSGNTDSSHSYQRGEVKKNLLDLTCIHLASAFILTGDTAHARVPQGTAS